MKARSKIQRKVPAPTGRRFWSTVCCSSSAFPHEIPFAAAAGSRLSSFDFGLVLTWLVPAALIVGLDGLSPGRAAKTAFVASFAAHTVFFYWFTVVTVVYGGMPFLLGILAPLVPALYVAPFTALFAWGFARFGSRGLAGVLFGAALWVCSDWARGHPDGGLPLGDARIRTPPRLPPPRLHAMGRCLYPLVLRRRHRTLPGASVARREPKADRFPSGALVPLGATLVLLHAGGFLLNALETRSDSPVTVRVAAIQGNIEQGEKWEAARRERILATYLRLSKEAASVSEVGVDWIVWPETAVPGIIENDSILRARLAELARETEASLVVGGMGVEIDHEARVFSGLL